MKTGLWVVIVVVTGIVGYLVGYSVSSYTGVRKAGEVQAHGNPKEAAKAAAAPAAPGGGYGGAERPAAGGGYGAPEKPAAKPPVKPAAAGY